MISRLVGNLNRLAFAVFMETILFSIKNCPKGSNRHSWSKQRMNATVDILVDHKGGVVKVKPFT